MAVRQGIPKLSLMAQFDDLCRINKELTSGSEEEFKFFAENQLKCIREWKESDAEVEKLRNRISHLESEDRCLKTKIKHLKNLFEDAETTRRKLECDKKCLERTIAAVKDVILPDGVVDNQTKEKLNFLSSNYKLNSTSPRHLQTIQESAESLFPLSDIDQTDDDLENSRTSSRQSRGKRSSSMTSQKKNSDEAEEFLKKVNKETDEQSNSDPLSSSPDIPTAFQQNHKRDSDQYKFNIYDQRYDTVTSGSTAVSRRSSMKYFSKIHQFQQKRSMKSVKCLPCRQNIACLKKSLLCKNCGIACHVECVDKCSKLCFRIINTPTKGTAGTVADYTSSSSPMIPPLIIHCVREIETRGMQEIGLYRISGSERDVKTLVHKFVIGRIIPSLNDIHIHALCGAVKDFLRSLSEPLITSKLWQAFVDAANLSDLVESSYVLLGLVNNLPQPNRDTLSFLILHWQKVAESTYSKMTIDNLSTILGPTVVGYSKSEPSAANVYKETSYQKQVMNRLLSISANSWRSMMSVEVPLDVEGTPENIPAPEGRLLGPLYATV